MQTETQTNFERETARERFYKDVQEIRPRLPEDWRERFLAKWPAYNTAAGGRLLFDVYHLRTTDVKVLEIMRVIAAQYQAERTK